VMAGFHSLTDKPNGVVPAVRIPACWLPPIGFLLTISSAGSP
jgi:hypothetical protein